MDRPMMSPWNGGIEEVHQADGVNQRGVLEQNDALLQQQRGQVRNA